MFRQGLHIKTASIITDENVQAMFVIHLREMRDECRTPENFMKDCNDNFFRRISNASDSISLNIATKSMKFLGFHPKLQKKGFYTDGHNRKDVTENRDNKFLPRMQEYERRMQEYSGDLIDTIIQPDLLEGKKRVVLITHYESTFYCCEGKPLM